MIVINTCLDHFTFYTKELTEVICLDEFSENFISEGFAVLYRNNQTAEPIEKDLLKEKYI